jgi:hypothetical protein
MGARKIGLVALMLFMGLLAISLASAQIIISQPKALYSLGDDLSFTVKIDSIKVGYMDAALICSSGGANMYHSVPEGTSISLNRKLTPDYIANLSGSCHVSASYAGETENGQSFEISEVIDVNIMTIKSNVDAGNTVQIKGSAYKKNNQLVGQLQNAFVEVSANGESNLSASDVVKDGQFTVNLFVPETTHAGTKLLTIKVYDEDSSGNELNSGVSSAEVLVVQKLSRVNIALDKMVINPDENVTIIPFLYDMAGDLIEGQVKVSIGYDEDNILFEGLLPANQKFVFKTEKTTAPGLIKITGEKDSLSEEKSFEVRTVRSISSAIGNETLIITNTGNVPYVGDVEIKIGSENFVEEVNLPVGRNVKYALSAPNGIYEISVNGENAPSFTQPGVALTGNAINLEQVREGSSYLFSRYPIVWIFLFVVAASLLYVWYRKHDKEKRFGNISLSSSNKAKYQEIKRKGGVEVVKPEEMNDKIDKIVLQGDVRKAEQVLVLNGRKNPASVIAIKIKSDLQGIANDSFKKSLEYAYKNKAVSYSSGDFLLLIFSPLLTKTFKNDEVAIKAASDIDNYFKDHNRKFRNDKISYGIGVNSGDIINKVDGRILQFTNVGKTISVAKRIADIASDDVLLSKEIHEKTPSVKAEKFATGAMDVFSIKRIVDNEQSQKFINEFLRRNTTK